MLLEIRLELWVQLSEESETSAGRVRDAEASSAALQTQLKQLQDSQQASASQHSPTQEAPISQEDADGMLLSWCWLRATSANACLCKCVLKDNWLDADVQVHCTLCRHHTAFCVGFPSMVISVSRCQHHAWVSR